MQKGIRVNECQLTHLAQKAKHENNLCGYLFKKSADTGKWQLRWFALYQNLLFYYDNESASRPSGVCLLEGCYCERIVTPSKGKDGEKQHCFTIFFRTEGQRQYDLRVDTEPECDAWMEAIRHASYCKNLEQKEQLEQKHLHLLQILDSERQAKWHYVQQTEELVMEVKKLKNEVTTLKLKILREHKRERKISNDKVEEESEEIRKIKKVQSFFRGWLCRRRWKQIVEEYIRSDHAESMRKRNSIVFGMVECEEEYVKQLSTLVSVFLRPFRMAASSKKPPITHEDVNSIFLNSETLLFLHQIFLKGLMARMENWPTLVLGDLFDMLLPMLGIYQEYVRNHHYSLQVLAEYKQKSEFNELLSRYEEKPICEGRTLEMFLTYPMHQVPRYIITIHELLAHTPHDHVERKSLEFAQGKLEELSQVMQDEVSETENIRKNLAIERMIVQGCDILLDVNQTFVRQGSLLQVLPSGRRSRIGSISTPFSPRDNKKDCVRQVFLFTNHMLLTTRASNGRLHLPKHNGKIPLIDCTLIEDCNSEIFYFDDDTASLDSNISNNSGISNFLHPSEKERQNDYNGLDFRVIVDYKSGPPVNITLVASSLQEKAAWCSDISQCIEVSQYNDLMNQHLNTTDPYMVVPGLTRYPHTTPTMCIENLHYSDLINSSMTDISSVTMPQSVRSDPKLFRDDKDIKFSRTLNSCKVPQIRHASVDKLLGRLTDLRFLSIDFLNTFLLTYRVFTTGETVLCALKRVYKNPEYGNLETSNASLNVYSDTEEVKYRHSFDTEMLTERDSPPEDIEFCASPPTNGRLLIKPHVDKPPRRISTGCMPIEVTVEKSPQPGRVGFMKYNKTSNGNKRFGDGKKDPQPTSLLIPAKPKLAPIASCETLSEFESQEISDSADISHESSDSSDESYVTTAAITLTTNTNVTVASSAPTTFITFSHNVGESATDSLDGASEANNTLTVPLSISSGNSSDTLTSSNGCWAMSSAASSDTLVPSSPCFSPIVSPLSSPKRGSSPLSPLAKFGFNRLKKSPAPPIKIPSSHQLDALALSPATSPKFMRPVQPIRRDTAPSCVITGASGGRTNSSAITRPIPCSPVHSPVESPNRKRVPSPISYSFSSPNIITNFKARAGKRGSEQSEHTGSSYSSTTPRSSIVSSEMSPPAKAGTVVTSSRASKRRSSSTAATTAFAVATAGSTNPKDHPKGINRYHSAGAAELKPGSNQSLNKKRESVISTAASMRVLNVLRHWVSKHSQDFESDSGLRAVVKDLLEEMVCNTTLCPAEHKAAASILRVLTKEEEVIKAKIDLNVLLTPPQIPTKDTFDTLSALDIAEQLTYLDHQIFMAIRSEELLSQAWMKLNKSHKAPHVLLVSKRFNEVSRLVVSEIVSRQNLPDRVACIEKWAAIADICRCMHNYNGVLQICAAFVNASVYRLKKTWEKIAKQTKQMIEKLQTLVSSESRFKNMRDALHRCDPPCIPYLGMYLTDLSFIEEGTPNTTEEGLVNFSKMRMIAHVIREIQHFQQTSYRIEHHKRVTNYLLGPSRLLDDEITYRNSLEIEPRTARVSVPSSQSNC